jgi:hypothetical protein
VSATSELSKLSEAKLQLLKRYVAGTAVAASANKDRRSGIQPLAEKQTHSPRLRQLSLDDYPQVVALESRYGLGFKSFEQWSHIWLNNPAYHELKDKWIIGWVLENDKGELVGAHENIPLFYELGGRKIVAAQGRGWVLEPRYRGYSLWLLMSFFEQPEAELCFDTTAGMEAAKADVELGAVRVPVGTWDRDVFWITNYPGMLTSWMLKKAPRPIAFLARPLAYSAAPVLFLRDQLKSRSLPVGRQGYSVEYSSGFDDRFDVFWADVRKRNTTLLAVRTRKTLEWHFAYALRQNQLWILTTNRNGRMVAYAIFLQTKDTAAGVNQVTLVDFQTTSDPTLLLPMVSVALERCRKEGVHLLENIGLSFDNTGINQTAPYNRLMPWWRYFYKARDKELAGILKDPRVWSPSLYDGDASIL